MSDLFVQSGTNEGTTTASVTLTGVVAGNTIVVVAGPGNTITPATHTVSDGQGSYTAQDVPITDAANTVWLQSFTLENANAGSHTITATFDSGNAVFIIAAEIGASGAGSFSGAKGAKQSSPGTGTDALSSGSVTVTGASTLLGFSVDTSSTSGTDEPTAGTGFASRANGVGSATIGAWRLFSKAAAANAAVTATAPTGVHEFSTIGVAILNTSGGGGAVDNPRNYQDGIPGAWYTDPGWAALYGHQQQGIPLANRDNAANVVTAVGSIAGTATVIGVGASTQAAVITELGTGAVTGIGASTQSAVITELGQLTANMVGTSSTGGIVVTGDGSITATATVIGVGAATQAGVISALGAETSNMVGASTASAVISALGTATVTAQSGTQIIVSADGSITARATVKGVPPSRSHAIYGGAVRSKHLKQIEADEAELMEIAAMLVPLISRGGPLCLH